MTARFESWLPGPGDGAQESVLAIAVARMQELMDS